MKKKKNTKLKSILWITAAVALALSISPVSAQSAECAFGQGGQCNSPGDGLPEDSWPFYLSDQTTSLLNCPPELPSNAPNRSSCLDPNSKDLFVILITATANPSIISTIENPLEFISKPTSNLGLGIAIHEISPAQAMASNIPRALVWDLPNDVWQMAVRITENSDTTATEPLGCASEGTPNDQDEATIYTAHIKRHVEEICGQATSGGCWDNTERIYPPYTDFIAKYVKQVLAHETAHMLGPLRTAEDRRIGHHYPSGTNVILDQSVSYKIVKSTGKVTWYLGTGFTADDIANAILH